MPTTAADVIKNALMEMGAYSQGETPSAEDSAFALSKLNRLLDSWNAKKLNVYCMNFTSYTITPSLQPHTIGSSGGTFTVTQRPVKIEAANLILNNVSPSVRVPLEIRDADWWAGNQSQGVSSQIPTDLYYAPAWPLGKIYLWPVPTYAFGLELETWELLTQLASGTTFTMPPGYEDAVTYSLAESLCPAFGKQIDPVLAMQAQKARALIQGLNSNAPRISTRDSGVPGGRGGMYNWRTGEVS